MTCRYCSNPLPESEAVVTRSYWMGEKHFCHKACKASGEREEAIECQSIDADCNDCKHFKRGALEQRMLGCVEGGRASRRLVNMGWFSGHCLKFDRPTTGSPNKWTGMGCFEHRRGLQNPATGAR